MGAELANLRHGVRADRCRNYDIVPVSQVQAAKLLNVSRDTVSRATRIKRKWTPDFFARFARPCERSIPHGIRLFAGFARFAVAKGCCCQHQHRGSGNRVNLPARRSAPGSRRVDYPQLLWTTRQGRWPEPARALASRWVARN